MVTAAEPSDKPALKLELDDAGVKVAPGYPRTPDGYTPEEMELRVERARIGLYVPALALVAGGMTIAAASAKCVIGEWTESCNRIQNAGIIVMSAGGAGMIASGIVLGVRKRKLRRLKDEHYVLPPQTRLGYSRKEAELRVKRAKIGLGASAGTTVLGVAFVTAGSVGQCRDYAGDWVCQGGDCWQTPPPSWCQPLTIAGATFIAAGFVGMVTTGVMSSRRTRDRDWRADYQTPRRVQWDLARSRLVF